MNKEKTKKQIIADKDRQILELKAQLIHVYHFAKSTIDKAGEKYMMGSGVLVQITALGGREISLPFVIKDGLSQETINAIKADLIRTYELSTIFKP
jgi:hypothetical protein